MRFLKQAVLMCSLLMSALALLAIVSLRNLPAQTGRGGGVNAPSRNGDVDCDGQLTITDPIVLLNYLFLDGAEPCAAAQEDPGCCKEIVAKLDQIEKALVGPCKDPMNRLESSGDGTVTDLCSGLMWQGEWVFHDVDLDDVLESKFNWNQANNIAKLSRVAGHSDWRIPSVKEMETFMNLLAEKPYRFDRLPEMDLYFGTGIYYWTSTEFRHHMEPTGTYFTVNFHPKEASIGTQGVSEKLNLILVRGAPVE